MKSLFDKYKWLRIVFGAILFSLGLVTLIVSVNGSGELLKTICIMFAIYCFVIALFGAIVALVSEKDTGFHGISSALLSCGILIGVGIAFCFVDESSGVIETIIQYCLPWILVAVGALLFIKFLILVIDSDSRGDRAAWVRALVAWVVLITLGIVCWVMKSSLISWIFITIGVIVMVIGILVIVAAIISMAKHKKTKEIEEK